jgi:alpha-beta hydrolase superfamily lysophospholipase
MFNYFSDNYTWSSTVAMGLMSGGQFGEMHRWLEPLRDVEPDMRAWDMAWVGMAAQQEDLAAADLKEGYRLSAGARYARAAAYRLLGERQLPPGPDKLERYKAAIATFDAAVLYAPFPIERVEIASPDGPLPGPDSGGNPRTGPCGHLLFRARCDQGGLYLFIREEFVRRGISVLIMDTPGVGAPLRLRGVPSRPDYEVPTAAIIDYLEQRADIDPDRIGILGISLGGYYAPRAAAFEPRIKACAAWGGVWDYGALWRRRWETQTKNMSVGFFQLQRIMGTQTTEEALERIQQYKLDGVMQRLTQPLLILHGAHDLAISVEDARKAFAAAGSVDKQLRIFSEAEGGAEHVQADEPDAARQMIADWFAQRFGTRTVLG